MTLILSVANPVYCLQVSDRLVTAGETKFDQAANKTVVYAGTDGIVALSYTGRAFLRGVPTDVRIASALTNGAASRGMGTQFGGIETVDVGLALKRVRDELARHSAFARDAGEIVATGWQWGSDGRRLRPVLWTIERGTGGLELRSLLPRVPARELNCISAGTDPFDDGEHAELTKEVVACGEDSDRAEEIMVGAIRRAVGMSSAVGPNCLSVLLPRPDDAASEQARIKFMPQSAHLVVSGESSFEVGYSPWLIAPGTCSPPSVLVGGMTVHARQFRFSLEGPEPVAGRGPIGAFSTQVRPRAPGWGEHPHSRHPLDPGLPSRSL